MVENGGFAGCRSRAITPPVDLELYSGLRIRVRGDGQRYKFIIRDDYNWNGIAWAFSFDTQKGEWIDINAPFDEFVPTLFARRVPSARFNAKRLTALQLTLSKFEYDDQLNPSFRAGPFCLEIDRIGAY